MNMNGEGISERICAMTADILSLEKGEVKASDSLRDLNIDSILFIRLVVMIETELSFQFEDEMLLMSKFDLLGDIIDYVTRGKEQEKE